MFLSLVQKRRSIRKFQAKPVEQDKIDRLIEAALRAPSSRGFNPWEFVVVTEPGMLEILAGSKQHGSAFLKGAPLGIVVCVNPEKSDVWVEDASIAATYIQLAAESMGLGNCWTQIRERMHDDAKTAQEYVAEVLNIPSNLRIECIVVIGYADEKKPPHGREELQFEKVHLEKYGRSSALA
jgi:nitroreductase